MVQFTADEWLTEILVWLWLAAQEKAVIMIQALQRGRQARIIWVYCVTSLNLISKPSRFMEDLVKLYQVVKDPGRRQTNGVEARLLPDLLFQRIRKSKWPSSYRFLADDKKDKVTLSTFSTTTRH